MNSYSSELFSFKAEQKNVLVTEDYQDQIQDQNIFAEKGEFTVYYVHIYVKGRWEGVKMAQREGKTELILQERGKVAGSVFEQVEGLKALYKVEGLDLDSTSAHLWC